MTVVVPSRKESAVCPSPLTAAAAAALPVTDVLDRLGSGPGGLPEDEAQRRLQTAGPNAVRSHRARALPVLARQLRSPLLVLLAVTALASAFVGQASDAVIIGTILLASVGLGFVNEYKAEKAAEALHSSIRHRCVVLRDGHPRTTDVTELVPGDVVDLQLGQVVPADLRLLATAGLECDESVLTGESLPAEKTPAPVPAGTPLAELGSCALMGTVVQAGSGTGVVVATGGQAEFGRIALGLGERQPETEFQVGLRKFSMLLVQVAGVLTGGDLRHQRDAAPPGNRRAAVLAGDRGRDLAAAASGGRLDQPGGRVTPAGPPEGPGQAPGLHRGPRQRRRAVHRQDRHPDRGQPALHAIGRPGRHGRRRAVAAGAAVQRGRDRERPGGRRQPPRHGAVGFPGGARQRTALARYRRLATLPFDHERRLVSVLVEDDQGNRMVITKGAPEGLLDRCTGVPGYRPHGAGGGVRGRQPGDRGGYPRGARPVVAHPRPTSRT